MLAPLRRIFDALDGDVQALEKKTRGSMAADFLLLPERQEVEHDEVKHFTRARALTLSLYPQGTSLGFSLEDYVALCDDWWPRAERGFAHRSAVEFPGPRGRMRQRAYFDAFRDLVAPYFGQGPVLRVAAPESERPDLALARFRALVER